MPVDLRVVVRDGDRHALLMGASLSKNELYIYAPMPGGANDLRQSVHASGAGHIHTPAGRQLHKKRAPLGDFMGRRRFFGAGTDPALLDWDYKPKPNKAKRRTMVLPVEYFDGSAYPSCSVELAGVEHGRADLVSEQLRSYPVVIDHLLIDFTQPQLLAVAWSVTWESAAALDRAAGRFN